MPALSPDDLVTLAKPLSYLAFRVGRFCPRWILDHNDLMQLGWLGVLSVKRGPDRGLAAYRNMQLMAAERKMINGLRAVCDSRFPTGRKRDLLVPDILRLGDMRQEIVSAEDTLIRGYDLRMQMARLSPRLQRVIRGRLAGQSLPEMATELHLTQGRVSQMISQGVHELHALEGP